MKKLFDSELKLMQILWEHGTISAKQVSLIAGETVGWNKNTTYAVLKKLEAKGFLRREEPGFLCTPLYTKEEIQQSETRSLLDKLFNGSKKALFSALLQDETLSEREIDELREMIEKR